MREGQKRDFARGLRSSMTDAERKVWYHLRDRRLLEAKFRRQFPIGRYVVDFICLDARLIVEIDGGQHNGSLRDATRRATGSCTDRDFPSCGSGTMTS